MSYSPIRPREQRSLNEAIDDWNKSHPNSKIEAGSSKVANIGKTIFVRYDENRGYSIIQIGLRDRCRAFFARKFSCCCKTTRLSPEQKKELADVKTLSLATQLIREEAEDSPEAHLTRVARVKLLYGTTVGSVYAILMNPTISPPRDIEKLEEAYDILKNNPKIFEISSILGTSVKQLNLQEFTHKLIEEIKNHYKDLQGKAKQELDATSYGNVRRAEEMVKTLMARVLDKSPLSPSLQVFSGLWTKETHQATLAELQRFQKEADTELLPEERKTLAEAIAAYEFLCKLYDEDKATQGAMIRAKLEDDLKSNRLNSDCILPMGSKNHATLFKLRMVAPGSFTLTEINTGAGVHPTAIFSRSRSWGNQIVTTARTFEGLTLDDLTAEFFTNLLRLRETSDQETMQAFLNKSLSRSGITQTAGQQVNLQKRGSCTAQCGQEYLRGALGRKLYAKYNARVTADLLEAFNKTMAGLSPKELSALFPQSSTPTEESKYSDEQVAILRREGEKVVERRQARARKLTADAERIGKSKEAVSKEAVSKEGISKEGKSKKP